MENTMEVTCSRSLALKEIGLSGYQYRIKIRSCFPFFFFLRYKVHTRKYTGFKPMV